MTSAFRTAMIVSAVSLAACGKGGTQSAASKAAAAAPVEGTPAATAPTYFTVPPNQLSHVQIAEVRTADLDTDVKTTGTVDWDNDHTTQAITQVGGPITRLLVDTGTHVAAGQPLLYVASPDVTAAFSTYRKTRNRLDLARRNLERNRDLLEHKAISQRDFDQVQADYNDAQTDVETAAEALHILGVPQNEIKDAERADATVRPELPMRAPIAGIVVQKLVNPGQVIQAGTTIAFVISDVSTVWVQGHVYEQDLRQVRVGDHADITSASFPTIFHGHVTYIGSMLDPATRTTPVRIVTANPGGLLKKDQFVNVVMHGKTLRKALIVPTSAVLYDPQNMPFVYVQVEPGKFAQRAVTIGQQEPDDDVTEVKEGLKAGDKIVGQGSLFLQFANSYQG